MLCIGTEMEDSKSWARVDSFNKVIPGALYLWSAQGASAVKGIILEIQRGGNEEGKMFIFLFAERKISQMPISFVASAVSSYYKYFAINPGEEQLITLPI